VQCRGATLQPGSIRPGKHFYVRARLLHQSLRRIRLHAEDGRDRADEEDAILAVQIVGGLLQGTRL
jgi:hypothetical protein